MKQLLLGLCLLGSVSIGSVALAHEVNPAVVEALTGETIEYADHQHSYDDEVIADPRDESRTFYSFPEWYIVYSSQEYAEFVAAGGRPSQFPYFAAIGQMWDSWELSEAGAGAPPDATTNTVLWTIALSFTAEYGLKGIYENTIGRLSEWLHFGYKSTEDEYLDSQAIAYGEFLNQTPWYEFSYGGSLMGLWKTYGWSSISPRGLERRVIYTVGYLSKALYAGVIGWLSAANFEGGAGLTTWVLVQADEATLGQFEFAYESATTTGNYVVSLPRYRAFKDPAVALAAADVQFVSIQGHDEITLSLVTDISVACQALTDNEIFAMPLVSDETQARQVLLVPVPELTATLQALTGCGLSPEHIYDY